MKRTITALVLGISLLFASGGGGYAQDFGKGLEAAQRGNYAVAYWEWTVAAEQGDAVAQLFLGQMFFEGLGVLQDYKVAKMWFEKSASNNISMAQNNLGSIYENGKGVAQDLQKAAIWYQKAAVQGDKNAQFNLGAFYFDEGGDLNLMYSYMWFKISLENGVNIARENVDFLKTKMSSSHLEKADFFIYECLEKQRGCLERLAHMTFNPLTQSR
jgi:TPR repeat protein